MMTRAEREVLLNDFAIRSFRNIADGDYIAARMALRVQLLHQYLWATQQAFEKYLKCILLLNRIEARNIGHDLGKALALINGSNALTLEMSEPTRRLFAHVDQKGKYRYLEISSWASGSVVTLDRAVWELRQYCTSPRARRITVLREGVLAPMVRFPGGFLEQVIDQAPGVTRELRQALVWQNAFFGRRPRRTLRNVKEWTKAENAPLSLRPEILDEVLKYVHVPKMVAGAYRRVRP